MFQPHDVGFLNEIEVFQVLRKGDEAVHFTKEPLEVGANVEQRINWDRRFDHMQQHSGRLVLTPITQITITKMRHCKVVANWLLGQTFGMGVCFIPAVDFY